jgi:hypothetical protein
MLPVYIDPETRMPATGKEHRTKKTINPNVMMDGA